VKGEEEEARYVKNKLLLMSYTTCSTSKVIELKASMQQRRKTPSWLFGSRNMSSALAPSGAVSTPDKKSFQS